MKKINFFSNFENQKKAETLFENNLSPIERIRLTVELIKRVYPDVKSTQVSKRITFVQVEIGVFL